jgi:hypothetical protein
MKLHICGCLLLASTVTHAHETTHQEDIDKITVTGRNSNLLGAAISASQGVVGQDEITIRPFLRNGEILELVPGMVVTQHSGTGKANQYFLRGFNLDHGTDFSTFIDGMPINMRTHGHGQGYTDLNFIISESVSNLHYKKGAYYADVGDFSGAGSAEMFSLDKLDKGFVEFTLGENNYTRLVNQNSINAAGGDWLYAFEFNQNDGPWTDINEDLSKVNLLLKHSRKLNDGQLNITFMGYDNSWNSADQIPSRAVETGLIDELGSLDTSVGGDSSRYSVSATWQNDNVDLAVYAIEYDMNLWSNFTYFLDDATNGDQFEQLDKRHIYGGKFSYQMDNQFLGKPTNNQFGIDLRYDDIQEVGLYHAKERQRLGTIRSDAVDELSTGLYWQNQIEWNNKLRTVFGMRYDYYKFDVNTLVDSNSYGVELRANNGSDNAGLLSTKGSVIYALDNTWESYFSIGQGFHSNDARGTTIQIDPMSGEAADSVDPLVASLGYEIGLRGFINDSLNTSIALWSLDLDSELLFIGDAGGTEASRSSERQGLEVTAYYRFSKVMTADIEYAYTRAKFSDDYNVESAEGNQIPGAIEHVLQAGLSLDYDNGFFANLRVRYFGERPLVEDGSVTSDPSTLFNLRGGYRVNDWTVKVDVFNLFDSNDHDIDYYYPSRLSFETADQGTDDIHYHVLEPRTLRLSVSYQY